MTIGPAPMIRIDLMSVRFGIGSAGTHARGASRAHKKRARLCARPSGPVGEAYGPRAARCLDQNRGWGKPGKAGYGQLCGELCVGSRPVHAAGHAAMPPRKPLEAQPFSLPLWLGGLVIGTALGLVVRSRLPAGVRAVSFDADGRQGVRADEATRSARLVGGTRLPHLAAKEEGLEARPGFEPGWRSCTTFALPLRHRAGTDDNGRVIAIKSRVARALTIKVNVRSYG